MGGMSNTENNMTNTLNSLTPVRFPTTCGWNAYGVCTCSRVRSAEANHFTGRTCGRGATFTHHSFVRSMGGGWCCLNCPEVRRG